MAKNGQRKVLDLFSRPFREKNESNILTSRSGGQPMPHLVLRSGGQPVPDLGAATNIPRGEIFSQFLSSHLEAAESLCEYLMRARDIDEFESMAEECRDLVNEQLFIYSLSFVILRKPELRKYRIPAIVEVLPSKFATQEMLQVAMTQVKKDPTGTDPIVIEKDFTGNPLKAEHKVAYWREDYGINSHHWHWHYAFPLRQEENRDRRGEIFFYMHQQMLARYDMERLCHGLNRTLALNGLREPIKDGYFSKLTVNNSGRPWGTRQDHTTLKDVSRVGRDIKISRLEMYYSRLMDAIRQRFMLDDQGKEVPLTDDPPTKESKRGIEILGDALEADERWSVNYPYYGNFHNLVHVLIAYSHDPDSAHNEENGVIGNSATAMRDPAFYRLHKLVDEIFQEYKMQQRPYTEEELGLPGIKVTKVGVLQDGNPNDLKTRWKQRDFEANRGLDFGRQGAILFRFTHLDHQPFDYHLQVQNTLTAEKEVTVRIFLAPTFDERGNKMSFMDQRLLWAEMDKFVVKLTPGENHLVRSSLDSSITAPEEATFRDLEAESGSSKEKIEFGQCGCGWPQHMLLPRGMPQGMHFQLFVMLTDYAVDKVDQVIRCRECSNAVSYCGILDSKFPDTRPMGFPFDRKTPEVNSGSKIENVGDLAAQFDNMLTEDIKITLSETN
ncbi:hemocyanin AA6 chain-like [Macrobrachium nipponense]|uniref:hemocyanin AA6 chain-like n=1 Tax=Macrobrachium nipponense TaxID=159736 RepID=UPI0030C7F164